MLSLIQVHESDIKTILPDANIGGMDKFHFGFPDVTYYIIQHQLGVPIGWICLADKTLMYITIDEDKRMKGYSTIADKLLIEQEYITKIFKPNAITWHIVTTKLGYELIGGEDDIWEIVIL